MPTNNPKPPKGYVLNKPAGFTPAVDSTTSKPLSSDIQDRRDPSLVGKVSNAFEYGGMRLGQAWDEIKREAHGDNSGGTTPSVGIGQEEITTPVAQGVPASPVDISFYNPAKDASRQTPPNPAAPKSLAELKVEAAKRNPAVIVPKIGQTKRFANGTIGVWDGHGWAAQR